MNGDVPKQAMGQGRSSMLKRGLLAKLCTSYCSPSLLRHLARRDRFAETVLPTLRTPTTPTLTDHDNIRYV